MSSAGRAADIDAGLRAVRARIYAACTAAGRDPSEVTLVAVSKTFPAADVRIAAGLGVHDVGENRDQEARNKAAELADLDLRWHFVGQLQRNKCASVARYATMVHSLDRPEIIDALAVGAERAARRIVGLVQVNLGARDGRGVGHGGTNPEQVWALAERIHAAPGLCLGGVMAIAPLGGDPADAFRRLAEIAGDISRRYPDARVISAGMSGDLAAAIAAGATHVRVGTAVFGSRPPMLLR
jgi:PLP dependent protein